MLKIGKEKNEIKRVIIMKFKIKINDIFWIKM